MKLSNVIGLLLFLNSNNSVLAADPVPAAAVANVPAAAAAAAPAANANAAAAPAVAATTSSQTIKNTTTKTAATTADAADEAAAAAALAAVKGKTKSSSSKASSSSSSVIATSSAIANTDDNDDDDGNAVAHKDTDPNLTIVGTWSSKSNQVFTGPGFYDPVDELIIEPSLPGISYSFSEDGWFEEASYQVSGNPRDPTCPTAAITFQHGKYEVYNNGSLILTPISVDGRQLISDPCNDKGTSTYTRYSQQEVFKSFLVVLDDYHGVYKLLLNQFDGSPMQPLYLAYRPPMMLPTETLNPTDDSSNVVETDSPNSDSNSSTNQKRDSLSHLVKRSLENKYRTNAIKKQSQSFIMSNAFWYISASIIGMGSLLFFVY
ncbi:Reversal of tor2 lethality [Monosporozyma unispora]|nr:Reversal of tor2 lethality [Kazachstania unispora]